MVSTSWHPPIPLQPDNKLKVREGLSFTEIQSLFLVLPKPGSTSLATYASNISITWESVRNTESQPSRLPGSEMGFFHVPRCRRFICASKFKKQCFLTQNH